MAVVGHAILGGIIMNRTIEYYKTRIHQLEQKDESLNRRIISKLKRKVRAMENKGQE